MFFFSDIMNLKLEREMLGENEENLGREVERKAGGCGKGTGRRGENDEMKGRTTLRGCDL